MSKGRLTICLVIVLFGAGYVVAAIAPVYDDLWDISNGAVVTANSCQVALKTSHYLRVQNQPV